MHPLLALLLWVSMAAPLPTQVQIQGEPWKIEAVSGPMQVDACNTLIGLTHCREHRIEIDTMLERDALITVVIHELQHALTECEGQPYAEVSCVKVERTPDANLHQVIYDTSPRWRRLLHDNPDLVKFLTQ